MLCIINTLCRQGYLDSRGIARTVVGFLTKNRPSCINQRAETVEYEQTVLIKPHLLLPYLKNHFSLWSSFIMLVKLPHIKYFELLSQRG